MSGDKINDMLRDLHSRPELSASSWTRCHYSYPFRILRESVCAAEVVLLQLKGADCVAINMIITLINCNLRAKYLGDEYVKPTPSLP